jgi:2-keto-3-deoxy-L-fuconate dehydrogenase
VHVLDISPKDAEAVAAEISSAGGTASAHACDVGNQSEVVARFSELFRHDRISILVNNAGISHIGNAENTPEADFDRVLRVNVKGFYNCIHATVGHMKANGGGVIQRDCRTGSPIQPAKAR